MKSKKIILGTFTAILSIGLLFGCGSSSEDQETDSNEEPAEQEENRKSF